MLHKIEKYSIGQGRKENETKRECEYRLKIEIQQKFLERVFSPMLSGPGRAGCGYGEVWCSYQRPDPFSLAAWTASWGPLWKAGLGRPRKAKGKVLSEQIKNSLTLKVWDDVAWKQPWLGKLGLNFSPRCPLCRASLHCVQQHIDV